jgi:hypothetical protein
MDAVNEINMISTVYRIFYSSSSSNRCTFTDISFILLRPLEKEKIFIEYISNYAQ